MSAFTGGISSAAESLSLIPFASATGTRGCSSPHPAAASYADGAPAEVRANPEVIAAYLGVPTAADDRALKEAG